MKRMIYDIYFLDHKRSSELRLTFYVYVSSRTAQTKFSCMLDKEFSTFPFHVFFLKLQLVCWQLQHSIFPIKHYFCDRLSRIQENVDVRRAVIVPDIVFGSRNSFVHSYDAPNLSSLVFFVFVEKGGNQLCVPRVRSVGADLTT